MKGICKIRIEMRPPPDREFEKLKRSNLVDAQLLGASLAEAEVQSLSVQVLHPEI